MRDAGGHANRLVVDGDDRAVPEHDRRRLGGELPIERVQSHRGADLARDCGVDEQPLDRRVRQPVTAVPYLNVELHRRHWYSHDLRALGLMLGEVAELHDWPESHNCLRGAGLAGWHSDGRPRASAQVRVAQFPSPGTGIWPVLLPPAE